MSVCVRVCLCACVRAYAFPRLQVCCGVRNRFWELESDSPAAPSITVTVFFLLSQPLWLLETSPFSICFALTTSNMSPLSLALIVLLSVPSGCVGDMKFYFLNKCERVVDFYNLYRGEFWMDVYDQEKGLP